MQGVLLGRWSNQNLIIPNWVIHIIVWINVIRSFSYGAELFFIVSNNQISPLMAFANVFGIQLWGILMLVSVAIFILGMCLRSTSLLCLGSLCCLAVWTLFAFVLCIGALNLGEGGRFAIAAGATALTWIVFFSLQLSTIRRQGLIRD